MERKQDWQKFIFITKNFVVLAPLTLVRFVSIQSGRLHK
jgi:hypothetical protein